MAHSRLKALAQVTCSNRDLDSYLWLAGQLGKGARKRKADQSTEVNELRRQKDPQIKQDIAIVLGNGST